MKPHRVRPRAFPYLILPGRLLSCLLLMLALCQGSTLALAESPALPDPSPFGVNFLKWEFLKGHADVWEDLRNRMEIMKGAGIYWDRDGIDKNTVNPHPGEWNWDFTDRVVALSREEGIHLAVILMGGGPPRDQAARDAYAEYVYQVVNRYHDTIKVWEIWNEPNIPAFWKNPDVHLYTLMLKAAYAAAKRADPDCVVLGGSANGPGDDWFNGIADEGGWNFCDAISMHPYALAPDPIRQRLDLILRTLRQVVDSHGPKPIWITEVGWQAKPDPAAEADQATRVFQTYVISLANGIRNIDYFCMDNYDNWGLIRSISPFQPKPSYYALQRLTRALGSPGQTASFTGYLKMPPGAACFVFAKTPGDRMLILWNNDGKTRTIALPQRQGLAAVDILGKPVAVLEGRLNLGKTPVIVTGANARQIGQVSPDADPFLIPRGANLLYNGALEASRDPATGAWRDPGSWYPGVFNAGGKNGTLTVSDQGRHRSTCVVISRSTGEAAWNNAIIPIVPGKRYRLTAWIKTEAAAGRNAAAIFWYNGNMWTPVGTVETRSLTGTQTWTRVTVEGTAPRNAAFARVHLLGDNNPGTAWYDDVSLAEE